GKSTDWEVHMIGQAIGAYTDATHGMTLSAVSLPYYRHIILPPEQKSCNKKSTNSSFVDMQYYYRGGNLWYANLKTQHIII
ncbi:MAG: hypothetical protein IIX37_00670, partial [Selenomonadaceae bacterium]|nr:hypothetical protein [Selenomonadaceae bacterium]